MGKIKNKIIISGLALIILCGGFYVGWLYRKNKEPEPSILLREISENNKLVHPVLLLQVPEDDSTPELQVLKKVTTKYVAKNIEQKNAENISVYFRELETNKWIGINADEPYAPASTLKVASMIAFYRAYQDDTTLLSKKIILRSTNVGDDKQDYSPPVKEAKIGGVYTARELLSYMISYSDNNALEAINFLTGVKTLNETYNNLRIPIPTDTKNKTEDFFTVKMMSRLYRSLYNGTYISQPLSEQALELLTKTDFDKGIVSGVPSGTLVAHKFGEKTINTIGSSPKNNKTVHELHDCGIVYVPNNPYFICVMTKGDSFDSLAKVIQGASALVWQETQQK